MLIFWSSISVKCVCLKYQLKVINLDVFISAMLYLNLKICWRRTCWVSIFIFDQLIQYHGTEYKACNNNFCTFGFESLTECTNKRDVAFNIDLLTFFLIHQWTDYIYSSFLSRILSLNSVKFAEIGGEWKYICNQILIQFLQTFFAILTHCILMGNAMIYLYDLNFNCWRLKLRSLMEFTYTCSKGNSPNKLLSKPEYFNNCM